MALNPKYMFSPNLQEFFIDPDTNLPLTAGFVNYYQDNDRNTRKPVYQLSGSYDAGYTFTQLPNPLQLGGAGTTVNNAGADIRVYYYPYDMNGNIENYYITVTDSNGNEKLVRQAWPNLSSTSSAATNYNYNFVRNPSFYYWNYGSTQNINVGTGSRDLNDFMFADWTYDQNDSSQNIDVLQGTFSASDSDVPGNPIYYLIYRNNTSGSNLGTINKFSQTYKSVKTLSGQNVAASIWINQVSGSAGSFSLTITQDFGSGGSSSVETDLIVQPALTVGNWTQYTGNTQLPSVAGKIIGSGNQLILNMNMPVNLVCEIHITQLRMNEGLNVTDSTEISNDDLIKQTNTIGLYPAWTTGDVKPTLKNVADPGWLMMNDQTIGNPLSGATNIGFSYFPLFLLIWNNVNNNTYAPIFDSTGTPSTYGVSAVADWNAQKRLSMTKILGRALASAGQASGYASPTHWALAQYPVGEEAHVLTTNEMPNHQHTLPGYTGLLVDSAGSTTPPILNVGTAVTPLATGFEGGGKAHNNIQPTAFYNFMIKL